MCLIEMNLAEIPAVWLVNRVSELEGSVQLETNLAEMRCSGDSPTPIFLILEHYKVKSERINSCA